MLTPDPAHRLLGYAICACGNEADRSAGLCAACTKRLRGHGGGRRQQRQDGLCAVCRVPPACRPAAVHGLCLSCNRLRSVQGQSVENFIEGDERFGPAEPRPSFGPCAVVSCERLASHAAGMCHPHDKAWRQAGRPQLEEFGRTAAPVRGDRQGRVVLRGLPERVITELLYGIQASVAEGRTMKPKELRTAVDHMRRLGVGSVTAAETRRMGGSVRQLLIFVADQVVLASSDMTSECAKDVWDLRVWGQRGLLSFVGGHALRHGVRDSLGPISQDWLRDAAKAWAAQALSSTGGCSWAASRTGCAATWAPMSAPALARAGGRLDEPAVTGSQPVGHGVGHLALGGAAVEWPPPGHLSQEVGVYTAIGADDAARYPHRRRRRRRRAVIGRRGSPGRHAGGGQFVGQQGRHLVLAGAVAARHTRRSQAPSLRVQSWRSRRRSRRPVRRRHAPPHEWR